MRGVQLKKKEKNGSIFFPFFLSKLGLDFFCEVKFVILDTSYSHYYVICVSEQFWFFL